MHSRLNCKKLTFDSKTKWDVTLLDLGRGAQSIRAADGDDGKDARTSGRTWEKRDLDGHWIRKIMETDVRSQGNPGLSYTERVLLFNFVVNLEFVSSTVLIHYISCRPVQEQQQALPCIPQEYSATRISQKLVPLPQTKQQF